VPDPGTDPINPAAPLPRPRHRLLTLAATCLAVAVSGAVLYALSPPASFGWFAYAPLAEVTGPVHVPLSGRQWSGLVAAAVGLLGAAAVGGYALGLRRAGAATTR